MTEQTPADAREPFVRLDFASAGARPEPFMLVLDEQFFDCGFTQTARGLVATTELDASCEGRLTW